jgi:hypothetical protein
VSEVLKGLQVVKDMSKIKAVEWIKEEVYVRNIDWESLEYFRGLGCDIIRDCELQMRDQPTLEPASVGT